MSTPLLVYLDSSDFSVLSDPARLVDPELLKIKDQLFRWKSDNIVVFVYSAAHVVECAAVEAQHTEKAKERSQLIFDLCGFNVFENFVEILRREALILAGHKLDTKFLRSDGKWFPHEVTESMFSNHSRLTVESLKPNILQLKGQAGWNKVRSSSALQKELLNAARRGLNTNRESTLAELMSSFSLEYDDADFLNKYALGYKTQEELAKYFNKRLANPKFLIQMRPSNYNGFSSLFTWMRSTSLVLHNTVIEVATNLKTMCEHADTGAAAVKLIAEASTPKGLQWNAVQLYEQIARSLLSENECDVLRNLSFEDFALLAPGSYSFVHVSVDSIFRSFAKFPRNPKTSDHVDALHVFYAPYVDVCRTDGFMEPITTKYVDRYGTAVVGKLTDLVEVIEKLRRD